MVEIRINNKKKKLVETVKGILWYKVCFDKNMNTRVSKLSNFVSKLFKSNDWWPLKVSKLVIKRDTTHHDGVEIPNPDDPNNCCIYRYMQGYAVIIICRFGEYIVCVK